jgi:hypothetical protein
VAGLESWSIVPVAHASHEVVAPLAYVPAGHFLHCVPGLKSVSALPAAQGVHFTDPSGAYEPLGHWCSPSLSHGVAGFLS